MTKTVVTGILLTGRQRGYYVQCDKCSAVFDRRPPDDHREGGTYRSRDELYRAAELAGWQIVAGNAFDDKHLCPLHAYSPPPARDP